MSEEVSLEGEGPVTPNGAETTYREYNVWRERPYEQAVAKLEAAELEPQERAAHKATLGELAMVPLQEVMWPDDDPRYGIHQALVYGATLLARRAEIEARLRGKSRVEPAFSIHRYALTALHAFKTWRAQPEPSEPSAKLLHDAAHTRRRLRAAASMLVQRRYIRPHAFRCFDGGVTPEAMACDVFLLVGALRDAFSRFKFQLLQPMELMEAELVATVLLRSVTTEPYPGLQQTTLQYARALTLLDDASFQAELVLSELHNEAFEASQDPEWKPGCLFCACGIERQRHHRRTESPRQTRERKQAVITTMTAVLRHEAVAH